MLSTFLRVSLLLVLPLSVAAQLENVPAWQVTSPPDDAAARTAVNLRAKGASYLRSIQMVRPKPARTASELIAINPYLPKLLPGFERLMGSAEVSARYKELYDRKLAVITSGKLLSSHNYFDCETVLRLEDPSSSRKVLLVQADMDVVTDGSDPVRAPQLTDYNLSRTSDWYLPETSYSWGKSSGPTNPFLDYYPDALKKLENLRTQLQAEAEKDQGIVWRELLKSCDDQIYRIKARGLGTGTKKNLRARRFLLADRDPFVVVPVPWVNKSAAWSPQIGDYAAVIYKNRIYPAILGDSGPTDKVGEASLRLALELNPKANGKTRAVSDLTVTYLFFPRTASPRGEPKIETWHTKVRTLLDEIGGLSDPSALHEW